MVECARLTGGAVVAGMALLMALAGSGEAQTATSGAPADAPASAPVPLKLSVADVSPAYPSRSEDTPYPPEQDSQAVEWMHVPLGKDGVNFLALLGDYRGGVAFARILLSSQQRCQGELSLAGEGELDVFVNGAKALGKGVLRPPGLAVGQIDLAAGANVLLFRLKRTGAGMWLSPTLTFPPAAQVRQVEWPGTIILNEKGYWRHFFTYHPPTLSPQRLRDDGLKYLGEKYMARFDAARQRLAKEGKPPDAWCQGVAVAGSSTGFPFDSLRIEIAQRLKTGFPPAGWMNPDFDDSDWARQKSAFSAGGQVRAACMRSRFWVPDPAGLKDLSLRVTYRGGIRVFVNGKEIARRHLPAGELTDDVTAEEYPAEAYHLLEAEFQEKVYHGTGYFAGYWQKANGYLLAPEMPGALERCPRLDEGAFKSLNLQGRYDPAEFQPYHNIGHGCNVNRAGWERVNGLRDRVLAVAVPASALTKGENVLAVESRAALMHPLAMRWEEAYVRYCAWSHGGVRRISLAQTEMKLPCTLAPPLPGSAAGGGRAAPAVQVWVEDIHRRIYAPDYYELPVSAQSAPVVAARNGVFAGQVVIRADCELSGLKATVGKFSGAGGAADGGELAARALYPVGHQIQELTPGDNGRRLGNGFDYSLYDNFVRARYGTAGIAYFDHLSASPPRAIPANTAYPVWVSLAVPPAARPGRYAATVTIQADGLAPGPLQVPLNVEVLDWVIPSPRDFQTIMALEQSPYALAEQYQCPLWSPEHFKLLERTFAYLGQVNNGWLNVPVLAQTEFGNRQDSMVRISRKADGSFAADFAILDKYLDLAMRHCGWPRVVNFIVMHAGNPGDDRMGLPPMEAPVLDEAAGKTELLRVDGQMPLEQRRAFWKFLATAICEHMKSRGLGQTVYWGYTWDGVGVDPTMYPMLAEFAPGVYWTKGSHQGSPGEYVRAVATAYNTNVSIGFTSRKGWKNPALWLSYPRYWGTVIDCSDYSPPFSFRMAPDRAIAAGSRGLGRMGADYWGKTYLAGMKTSTYAVGVPNLFLLWPGADGAESSIRFEVLKEGLQETEARIFLEQAVEKLAGPERQALRERVGSLLDERTVETLIDSPAGTNPENVDLCAIGWQKRSRRLYSAAAEVAGILGLDSAATSVAADVPARGKAELALRLRNWTDQPRRWKLSSRQEWIRPEKAGGTLPAGQQDVKIAIDSTVLVAATAPAAPARANQPAPAANEFRGTLLLTDVTSGRSDQIDVTARVGDVFAVAGQERVYNVTVGQKETQVFTILNKSGSELNWRMSASLAAPEKPSPAPRPAGPATATALPAQGALEPASWIDIAPAGGALVPGGQCQVAVTARPGEKDYTRREVVLTASEGGGTRQSVRLVVYVLPAYRPPATTQPAGTPVGLDQLPPEALKSHRDGHGRKAPEFWRPPQDRPNDKLTLGRDRIAFPGGLTAYPAQETVYNVEDRGFRAFCAHVGPGSGLSSPIQLAWAHAVRIEFEVWVDGRLAATSGMMGPTDNPRALLVEGLATAKEVRLVTRAHNDSNQPGFRGYWAGPAFYK